MRFQAVPAVDVFEALNYLTLPASERVARAELAAMLNENPPFLRDECWMAARQEGFVHNVTVARADVQPGALLVSAGEGSGLQSMRLPEKVLITEITPAGLAALATWKGKAS